MVFLFFGGCVTHRFQIIARPPVPEALFAQPYAETIDIVPLASGTTRIEDPTQLVVDVDGYGPGQWMFALVTVASALVQAFDAINHCKLTQAGTVAKWRQVGLSDRSGYSKLNILIHSVDKL